MEDERIIDLYWARLDEAITQTDLKYGKMCLGIAGRMLRNFEDAEECVSDTYLGLWNAIPPARPRVFSAYIAKITRNLAMKRITYHNARKRSELAALSIHELEDCIPSPADVSDQLEAQLLTETIAGWLEALGYKDRNLFMRRYWFFDTTADLAVRFGMSEGQVKTRLCRLRKKLKNHLAEEGFYV